MAPKDVGRGIAMEPWVACP
ncbi:hypothetical protein LINPERHAP1_LOCUS38746 [Linum perenne]